MDVLNVEVLSCHHQGPPVAVDVVGVQSVVAVAAICQAQGVVATGGLLEGVDCLRGGLGTAVLCLRGLLHLGCGGPIVWVLDVHIFRGAFLAGSLEVLCDLWLHITCPSWTHVNIKVLNLVWVTISKIIFFHCSHHWLLTHASLNAVGLLVFSRMWITAIPHRPISWNIVLIQGLLVLWCLSSWGFLNSMYMGAASASLAVLFEHLLLLGGDITPVVLLENVVLDIRILLWRWRLSKLRTRLVELVSWHTSRSRGLNFHLARFWLAWCHFLFRLLETRVWSPLFLSATRAIVFFVLSWVVRLICNHRRSSCLFFARWLIPFTKHLWVVLILVKLLLVLTRTLIFGARWTPFVEVVHWRASRLWLSGVLLWWI